MPKLERTYIETGKVRYIFRAVYGDQRSRLAAESLYCAGEQGQFWAMHDWLFEHVDRWASAPDVIRLFSQEAASAMGLDSATFEQCLLEGRYRERVEAFLRDAQARGIPGTPAFLINDRPLVGAQPFSTFRQIIEEELRP